MIQRVWEENNGYLYLSLIKEKKKSNSCNIQNDTESLPGYVN